MNAWSNIEISSSDPEIIEINKLENNLGELPEVVNKIRELITRFEVCHFKYREHLYKIKNSILTLHTEIDPSKIGTSHIQHGDNAYKNDSTGRSFIGQQYVWAIKKWLDDDCQIQLHEDQDMKFSQQVQNWLGNKSSSKIRLVRLLLSRLTWDWKSYEELQRGGEFKDIEDQVSKMDICHYAFPQNLNLLLQGLGKMKPVENFEGCGSHDESIKDYISKQFYILNEMLLSTSEAKSLDGDDLVKMWLFACLAKTIKEQIGLKEPIANLIN
ncbi:MAG: hypothetical protein JW729_02580 [Bacteroidales bacterium]|nr:hypothetical protein [Bacteroidales bacterium]